MKNLIECLKTIAAYVIFTLIVCFVLSFAQRAHAQVLVAPTFPTDTFRIQSPS